MIAVGISLIAIGLVAALLGAKLFRLLLPVIGLASGAMAGFIGVQSVFGNGVVATSIALVVAVILGVLLAILSFAFFDLAVTVYVALLGAGIFSYFGVAIGLNQGGVLLFLLAAAGAIITATWASRRGISLQVVMALTSFVGAAYVLVGVMMVAGNVSLDQLNNDGVAGTIVRVVDQSFLWFIVWLGASIAAWQLQLRAFLDRVLTTAFEYQASESERKWYMAKNENKRLVRIKPTSWAVFQGSFASVLGLGVAILNSIDATVNVAQATDSVFKGLAFGLAAGVVSIVVLPFIYFALGWLVGLVQAWVYNTVLGIAGGVVVELKDE